MELTELSKLLREISPDLSGTSITIDSHIIDDLALDSLSRVQLGAELIGRNALAHEYERALIISGAKVGELLSKAPFTPTQGERRLPTPEVPPPLKGEERLYALYFVAVFFVLVIPAAATLLVPLGSLCRRRITRRLAQGLFSITGVPIRINGSSPNLFTHQNPVYVANHASYVDAVILHSILPAEVTFVSKGEFRNNRLMSCVLGALGVHFIERWDIERAIEDLDLLAQDCYNSGIVFFPEGTFDGKTELRKFKLGAFHLAALNNRPVIAIALTGTRELLPPGSWMPRRSQIEVSFSPPYQLEGSTWSDKLAACEVSRTFISKVVGEYRRN